MGPRGVIADWRCVVPIPLEFRLVRNAVPAADRVAAAMDRTVATEHVGRDRHSRDLQRRRLYSRR
jgi:hypothetical protein